MSCELIRETHPRLFHAPDDPDYRFPLPRDGVRKHILNNILVDCELFARRRPWQRLPERPDSPHPFHQLYITFYTGMQATALIENYAFAWRLTGNERWLRQARRWLLAACDWEHGDRIEEHFYTANRYMHAFAFALDLLGEELSEDEMGRATDCLVGMMERWWPEVDEGRHSPSGGHHAVVDNGHFGVAALYLLGKHPDAATWVEAVIDRFRAAIMPHGCGPAGEPVDGSSFWPWENMWMLHFADALRNATGVDLYREFPQRPERPLRWFRYHLIRADLNLGAGNRPVWSPTLLRLSQEAGDGDLRQVALGDEQLGRIYRFGVGVKGSSAECMIAYGPYAYMYLDPDFEPRRKSAAPILSRSFSGQNRSAVLRSGWQTRSLIARVSGYDGRVASGFSDLQVCWNGHPVLKGISCEEAQPLGCGSLPCVGGQNEFVALLKGLARDGEWDRLRVDSPRVEHEYWLLRGENPVLLVGLRRRKRALKLRREGKMDYVRLDGRDCLQYSREPHFNPDAGEMRMRVRVREEMDGDRPRTLWNTGIGIAGLTGTQVNLFSLGFFKGEGLVFAVQSQRYTCVEVRIPPGEARIEPGKWHEITVRWGGFNAPGGKPFIELELDGCRRRCDDAGVFGELEKDSQNLHSRTKIRTFYIRPNSVLAFGGAAQIPGTGTRCDIARIEVECPGRQPLITHFTDGLDEESGSGPLVWKLNPVELKELRQNRLRLGAGRQIVDMRPVFPDKVRFTTEEVPYAPSGLAAGSLKHFASQANEHATRVLASAEEADCLVLAFAPRSAGIELENGDGRLAVRTKSARFDFEIGKGGKGILVRR